MAAPVKDSVKINFSGGLNLKEDEWQIPETEFLALNNVQFGTGGRLSKRNGFAGGFTKTVNSPNPSLTYSNVPGTLTAARKIFSYNDELLLNDAWNLYSWDANSLSWNYKGRSTMVSLSTESIMANSNVFSECDTSTDTTTGVRIIAGCVEALVTTGTFISIQDTNTGQFVLNQSYMGANYRNPRCVSIAGKSWVFAVNISDHKLYYQAIVGQALSGSPTALITNLNNPDYFYDVDADPNTGNLYVAWVTNAGSMSIAALSSSMVVGNTITKAENPVAALSWFGDGTNIWVVYNTGLDTRCFIVNNAVSSTTTAPFSIDATALATPINSVTGVWSSVLGKAFIFYDQLTRTGSVTNTAAINYNTVTLSAGVATPGTPGIFCGSLSINSKATQVSGIPHIIGVYTYSSGLQATNFLLNLYNVTPSMGSSANNDVVANIAAKISPDEAQASPPIGGQTGIVGGAIASFRNISGSIYECALLQSTNYTLIQAGVGSLTPAGVIVASFDFSLTNPDVQTLGNNALISTGSVLMYDGASVVEQNFHIYPNTPTYTQANAGGFLGAAAATSYAYILTYEWIDNEGHVHRSFTSPATASIAFGAGVTTGMVTLTIPCLRVTAKSGTQVVIGVYRTVGNGSVYYRENLNFRGATGDNTSDPSKNSITYVSTLPDASLVGNIQLYTTGALGYYAPPAGSTISNFKNRAISVSAENPHQLGYSNAVQQNFPVQFVPEFLLNIGEVGGPLIAVSQMDDKMILFKGGTQPGPAIYYMVGTGPAPSGANNDFQDPLPVAVDVGCVDRPSIVLTPIGLMFKSDKGVYLLSRSLEALYIGAPVEAYNSYSVVSAQLIPDSTQVRFLLSSGVMLMYDYYYKRWATFTPPTTGVSDCIYQGQHAYVTSAGQVYKETPGLYIDGTATPVLMSFTTAWIKLAGLQGYQRAYFFYLLAEYISSHQIQLQIYYDFSTSVSQTTTITPDSANSLENWRIFLSTQRCQSFQIALTEVSTGTLGESFTLSGLNLIVGRKNVFQPFPAAQSSG